MPEHKPKPEEQAVHQLRRIADAAERQANAAERTATSQEKLVQLGRLSLRNPIVDFKLNQVQRRASMIQGIVPGNTASFDISYVPATNFIPLSEGPTVSTDDPDVTLSEVAVSPESGLPRFDATVADGAQGESFNVVVDGVNDQGTAVSHTFNIPILSTPPPPGQSITDFDLNQVFTTQPIRPGGGRPPAKAAPAKRR